MAVSDSLIQPKVDTEHTQMHEPSLAPEPEPKEVEGPLLSDDKELDGDHGRDERIEELLIDAKAHKYEALLALGMADIEKEALVKKIQQKITWGPDDDGFLFLIACLAKLGDEPSFSLIVRHLNAGNYVQQEAAADSLAYIGSKRSYFVLRKGLDDKSGLRQPFNPKEILEPESALAPPVRFSCLRVLDMAFPGSGIPEDAEAWTEKDIEKFKDFFDKQPREDNLIPR